MNREQSDLDRGRQFLVHRVSDEASSLFLGLNLRNYQHCFALTQN